MSPLRGTIVELNPHDALGWIELDDGHGRVRFGGSAMKGFRVLPAVGTRVEVRGTAPGFAGALKAVMVVPLDDAGVAMPAAPPRPSATPWADFVARHPRFSDAAATCVPCARAGAPLTLPAHPLFDPWREEIGRTAPTVVELTVPSWRRRDPIVPSASDSFALGRVAILETNDWPSCGLCGRGLRMCVQLAPSVMADFVAGGQGLVALFCFGCGTKHRADPRVGFVRLVTPTHRIEGPDVFDSEDERALFAIPQRVTAAAPRCVAPSSLWLRYRSKRDPDGAASALFDERHVVTFPSEVDADDADEPDAAYDDWVDAATSAGTWGGARLGGVTSWDQRDETPSCEHGERLHLLDYDGGQFLDGALHVFACRRGACELAFVAEF